MPFRLRIRRPKAKYAFILLFIILVIATPLTINAFGKLSQKLKSAEDLNQNLKREIEITNEKVASFSAQIDQLESEDLRKTNNQIKQEINDLKATYRKAYDTYTDVLSIRDRGGRSGPLESLFASIIKFLSKDDLKNADTSLTKLASDITKEEARLTTTIVIAANIPEIKEAPGSGYRRQKVVIDGNAFQVDIVAADLGSTRVMVDTAS
ncbi:hypothetical protein HYZ70_01770, partial [Candidatus Curtissbacteria bacterium]|nr:hypothetical protein [Candidatus Curtissbacteria bacterium]